MLLITHRRLAHRERCPFVARPDSLARIDRNTGRMYSITEEAFFQANSVQWNIQCVKVDLRWRRRRSGVKDRHYVVRWRAAKRERLPSGVTNHLIYPTFRYVQWGEIVSLVSIQD